ncbi:MAG: hypothetical protein WBK19_03625 [Azonexus sp.]
MSGTKYLAAWLALLLVSRCYGQPEKTANVEIGFAATFCHDCGPCQTTNEKEKGL